ncbi:uncharacterized protein SPSK_05479 [Sporothrix schenckii 1099-18]|uniref:Uncharacterized protein n=1 Tax=Sporothrix schenckii 1099-18 TaxID=1397361 RepID=A0A0F2LVD6_SPOSC|nr:uncharacterized protein SPSK_05479 [Sporothrix schenckii 1099-18]KJR80809.1 hypothetical protein SPSK_05479 [Sporothrix schenckii 1099-18]
MNSDVKDGAESGWAERRALSSVVDPPVRPDYRPTFDPHVSSSSTTSLTAKADADVLAAVYAKSAAAIAPRIAASEVRTSRASSPASPAPVSSAVSSATAASSDVHTATFHHEHVLPVPLEQSVNPPHYKARKHRKQNPTEANRHGVLFPHETEHEVSRKNDSSFLNPHAEPVQFARWLKDTLKDLLARDHPVVTGHIRHLFSIMDFDQYANFALRPTMTYVNLKRACNIEAVMITICGKEAELPCSSCRSKCGPFTKCMVISIIGNGNCSNCRYNGQGSRCSLYEMRL